MTATLAPKNRTIKEPSIENLAKSKARGTDGHKLDYKPPTLSEELARQTRERALKLADDGVDQGMPQEDRDFLYAIARGQLMMPTDVVRFARLSDRAAGLPDHPSLKPKAEPVPGNHNGNGHAKHAKAPKPVASPTSKTSLGPVVSIELSQINRHPDNRHPTKEDVAARAASITEKGQLEPIIVRKLGNGYQIISGETRYLAVKLNGGKSIECRIRDCTDAEALELVAEANGQRKDLNPIERAQLIEKLCRPIDDNGAGLTKDAAALRVGLKDGSSASNLVRLLKLPKVWQDRVAVGELPESFARVLCPLIGAPVVLQKLDEGRRKAFSSKGDSWTRDQWDSRSGVEELVDDALRGDVRPVEDGHKVHYGTGDIKGPKDDEGRYLGYHPRFFDLTPELEQQLGIIEWENFSFVNGKDRMVTGRIRMATNAKLFDQLNIPLIKQHVDRYKKTKAQKAGAEKPVSKKELTPAEQKARVKEQAGLLQRRVNAWRHDWLKSLVAREVGENAPLRELLLIAIAMRELGDGKFDDLGLSVANTAKLHGAKSPFPYEALVELDEDEEGLHASGTSLIQAAITTKDRDPKYPVIEHGVMEEIAGLAAIDIQIEWKVLQEAHEDRRLNGDSQAAETDRFALFFELFQSAQLDELGKELGVHVGDVTAKAAKIKIFTTRDRVLKLPSCIKPLSVPGKRKAKRGQ